jgi:hypothetical protein
MIKILHTADWHLKHKHSFTELHEDKIWDRMCEEKLVSLSTIAFIARRKKPDIVTIGGDIFDTSNPPEALKAELCKILNCFPKSSLIKIIPGRPGDHDYTNKNNFVIMDLMEAYQGTNIEIYDEPFCEVAEGVGMFHLMLDGISEFYKNTVSLDDERFMPFNTILLGDYHGWYFKKFGKKRFLYPNCPYPTRFGEEGGTIALLDIDDKGNIQKLRKINVPCYRLIDHFEFDLEDGDLNEFMGMMDIPFVLKFKVEAKSDELIDLTAELKKAREQCFEVNKNCMDVVWEIKSKDTKKLIETVGNSSVEELCKDYITDNAEYPKSTLKIFQKIESQL